MNSREHPLGAHSDGVIARAVPAAVTLSCRRRTAHGSSRVQIEVSTYKPHMASGPHVEFMRRWFEELTDGVPSNDSRSTSRCGYRVQCVHA